jgi:nuclear transport factor 2 (NTF2) superfamily protein
MAAAVPPSLLRYNQAWNERDPERIVGHLSMAVSDDVLFVDPAHTTIGRHALASMIRTAREAMPDATYQLASGIDGHNRRFRYRWVADLGDGVPLPGMDVTTVDDDGRIERIDGFFGDFPPLGGPNG